MRVARQRQEQVVGRVALGQAQQPRPRPIPHVHVDLRRGHDLMYHDICGPRNLFHGRCDLLRDAVIAGVAPRHLNVNGSGQAKVQNLRGDVGRQKLKRGVRELRGQLAAERLDVHLRWPVLFFQRDQHVAVQRADGGDVAERQVDAADRQADVVNHGVNLAVRDGVPNHVFHLEEQVLGSPPDAFPRGARTCSRIRPASTFGKKFLPMKGSRQNDSAKNTPNRSVVLPRLVQRPRQSRAVAVTEMLEHLIEVVMNAPDKVTLIFFVLRFVAFVVFIVVGIPPILVLFLFPTSLFPYNKGVLIDRELSYTIA